MLWFVLMYMQKHMHKNTHPCTHMHTYIHIHTYTHVNIIIIHIHTCIHMYICTQICAVFSEYVSLHLCVEEHIRKNIIYLNVEDRESGPHM